MMIDTRKIEEEAKKPKKKPEEKKGSGAT